MPRQLVIVVPLLLSPLACSVTGSAGDEDGDGGDAPAGDGGPGASDGSSDPLADAGPPDVVACTEAASGALALEFTYDAPPVVTGGTIELQGSETWSLTQPVGSGRVGDRGVRSELRYGDAEAYGGPRAETALVGNSSSRYAAGDSFFYGFSAYVPAGWVDDAGNEDIMFQWHNIPDDDAGEGSKSPNLFLAIKRDEFVLRITSDANPVSTADSPLKEQALLVDGLQLAQGTWHDFVFHVVWSYQGFDGLIEAWHRTAGETGYRKVLQKVGPNMHNDELDGYVKWGIYKPSWRSGATAPSARVVMHDEIRVGESFGAVEPACPR
ncbi:MAG TPA: polysaccharide lyase [Kofleriaceae bacterium]|nr:polysaccharide lyase [Kofleriaceae bacterium]